MGNAVAGTAFLAPVHNRNVGPVDLLGGDHHAGVKAHLTPQALEGGDAGRRLDGLNPEVARGASCEAMPEPRVGQQRQAQQQRLRGCAHQTIIAANAGRVI
ncbi:MAG: hypothetical protein ACYDGR_06310 [Candidatus Dormibacteria bacterium]